MNTTRCLPIARLVPAAAAVIVMCSGCDKPVVIKFESPPVYVETLEEVQAEPPDVIAKASEDPAQRITFDDLNLNMQPDTLFEEQMLTDKVKQLTGQRVSLPGVMLDPGSFKAGDEFILLRNKENRVSRGFLADHLVSVKMRAGETIKYTAKSVRVAGTLHVEPVTGDDGNTWVIYVLKDATVAVVQ